MNFDPQRMLSFDLETTGRNPKTARIVTSAMVTINGKNKHELELLADPGVPIPEEATAVHGISTAYAQEHGQDHGEVLAETIRRIRQAWDAGATLVVYNAAYDLTVLRSLDPSFSVDGPVFDPYVVDRAKDQYRKGKRTLELVCEHYGVPLDNAHEATADAVAAARVAWKLAKKYPDLTEMSSDELMMAQARWHYDAQSSLQEYFTNQGKDVQVNTEWPVH
ncbi:MAG TPA: 3'-5' exonuclease [Candidatus Corynebacterium gallistercoris]|uniref:3'-5' exonuclease n=1 Tax=Candidatus Corynebacterium gallistercoris TaxID=2838530 RepID=A0A9D1RZH3_9CORY|nr:3'-5' exonuclease [Candidatus Corynebacterium gallistercoris]